MTNTGPSQKVLKNIVFNIIVVLTTIVNTTTRIYNYYRGSIVMISYAPFWETLKKSNETTYTLINQHRISSSTIDKLRKNRNITTLTVNDLCMILNCTVSEILEYIPDQNESQV